MSYSIILFTNVFFIFDHFTKFYKFSKLLDVGKFNIFQIKKLISLTLQFYCKKWKNKFVHKKKE